MPRSGRPVLPTVPWPRARGQTASRGSQSAEVDTDAPDYDGYASPGETYAGDEDGQDTTQWIDFPIQASSWSKGFSSQMSFIKVVESLCARLQGADRGRKEEEVDLTSERSRSSP